MRRLNPPWGVDLETFKGFYAQPRKLFDTVIEYDGHYWKKPINNVSEVPRYAAFLPWVRGQDILDVGCDGGALTAWLAQQGYNLTGMDIAEAYIALNRQRFPQIIWIHGAFEETNWLGAFDTIIAAEVLEHVVNPLEFVVRAKESLRPNGVFIGTVPCVGAAHERGLWYEEDIHLWSFSESELSSLLMINFSSFDVQKVCDGNWFAFRGVK